MRMSHLDRFLLAGIMGHPVMHSRSPKLHNFWLKKHSLVGRYVPLAVKPEGLAAALKALPSLGFRGCNLTIPHKILALPMMDRTDAASKRIGAINCVTVEADGSLTGTNNDGYGYIESVRAEQPHWKADAGPIVVLGAGGGARAVLVALADAGARTIHVLNRTDARATELAAALGNPISAVPWGDRNRVLGGAAMVINTTSQGMVGQPPLDISLDALPKTALVSDIIYIPRETALLAAARARGNPTAGGLGMLLHQARPAFKSWFGVMPEVTPELVAAIEATL
jgi:shikimate dehydrogenase